MKSERGADHSTPAFDSMADQALLFLEQLLGEIDLVHLRRRKVVAMAEIAAHLNHLLHRKPVLPGELFRDHRIIPVIAAAVRRGLLGGPSLAAVTDRASEARERMLFKVRKRAVRRERLRQACRKNRAPVVAEMAGYAAIDDPKLRVPDLPDTDAESARILDSALLLQDSPKALFEWHPFGAVLAPESQRHQHKETNR